MSEILERRAMVLPADCTVTVEHVERIAQGQAVGTVLVVDKFDHEARWVGGGAGGSVAIGWDVDGMRLAQHAGVFRADDVAVFDLPYGMSVSFHDAFGEAIRGTLRDGNGTVLLRWDVCGPVLVRRG